MKSSLFILITVIWIHSTRASDASLTKVPILTLTPGPWKPAETDLFEFCSSTNQAFTTSVLKCANSVYSSVLSECTTLLSYDYGEGDDSDNLDCTCSAHQLVGEICIAPLECEEGAEGFFSSKYVDYVCGTPTITGDSTITITTTKTTTRIVPFATGSTTSSTSYIGTSDAKPVLQPSKASTTSSILSTTSTTTSVKFTSSASTVSQEEEEYGSVSIGDEYGDHTSSGSSTVKPTTKSSSSTLSTSTRHITAASISTLVQSSRIPGNATEKFSAVRTTNISSKSTSIPSTTTTSLSKPKTPDSYGPSALDQSILSKEAIGASTLAYSIVSEGLAHTPCYNSSLATLKSQDSGTLTESVTASSSSAHHEQTEGSSSLVPTQVQGNAVSLPGLGNNLVTIVFACILVLI